MPRWPSRNSASATADRGDRHLELARESLRELIDDSRVPEAVREELEHEYRNVRQMLDKPTMEIFTKSLATLTGGSGAVAVLLTDGSFTP